MAHLKVKLEVPYFILFFLEVNVCFLISHLPKSSCDVIEQIQLLGYCGNLLGQYSRLPLYEI